MMVENKVKVTVYIKMYFSGGNEKIADVLNKSKDLTRNL